MKINALTYTQILVLVFAVLFVCTFLTLLSVRRQLRDQDGLLTRLSSLLAVDRSDSENQLAIEGALQGEFEQQIDQLRHQIDQVSETHQPLRPVPTSPALEEAVTMARQGVSADDIAQHFSLPRGEADLLVKLHRNPARTDRKGD
ncbi:MAG: DUF2802 domain-containing protein [Woeseiaceae bacterium]